MREQLYWKGIPVPYVALWSGESERYIAVDPNAGDREAVFAHGERGQGEPVWGKMHEARQRETIVHRRCQVCNCSLKQERSFAMDVSSMMRMDGKVYQVLTEPPACARCILYALAHCPGNRRILERGELRCFEVFAYVTISQIVGAAEGGNSDLNLLLPNGKTAVGYNKCVLTRAEQITVEEMRERAEAGGY